MQTEAEWQEWRDHPGTKEFLRVLRWDLKDRQEQWAAGALLEATPMAHGRAVGRCDLLRDILEMDYQLYAKWAEDADR